MKVKLCGFTEENSVKTAIAQNCDFIGFVFYDKSPRFISVENAAKISAQIPENIGKVAVLVDPDFEFLRKLSEKFHPDFFQFHGNESQEFLKKVRAEFPKIKIIKAFKITSAKDLELVNDYADYADFFMFDGKSAGSGEKFDWEILKNFHSKKSWFLAGGLNSGNIIDALQITGAQMIDISSGIEKTRGQKSPELIIEFMNKIKKHVS